MKMKEHGTDKIYRQWGDNWLLKDHHMYMLPQPW